MRLQEGSVHKRLGAVRTLHSKEVKGQQLVVGGNTLTGSLVQVSQIFVIRVVYTSESVWYGT